WGVHRTAGIVGVCSVVDSNRSVLIVILSCVFKVSAKCWDTLTLGAYLLRSIYRMYLTEKNDHIKL
ncbi:MAG: hypothetical protein RRY06_10180, partial [Lachnospiraceae bacterium]